MEKVENMTWKTITLALAVACTAVALVPRQAEALPSNEVYRYYYSDATMSDEVGMLYVTSCYGVVNELSGHKTAFAKHLLGKDIAQKVGSLLHPDLSVRETFRSDSQRLCEFLVERGAFTHRSGEVDSAEEERLWRPRPGNARSA